MPISITKSLLFFSIYSVFFSILFIFTPAVQSAPVTKVKLQMYWHHQFEFAGFYAAVEQGYFHQYGIEVEFIPFDPSIDVIDTVINEQADFGIAGIDIIQYFHEGRDVKLLASYFKRSPLVLITQPEITSLKQLSGKTIHGMPRLLNKGSIREMLTFHNVDPTSINSTMEGNATELFKDKKVSAILAFLTSELYSLNQLNIPFRIFDPNQFGMVTQDLNLFTTDKFAKEHPGLVKGFTKAANKGWQYALNHPDEIIALIKRKYNQQNISIEALNYEAIETAKLVLPELYDVGSVLKNKLEIISQKLLVNKNINQLRNIENLIFNNEAWSGVDYQLLASLTLEEKQYLAKLKTIKVQNGNNFPPFNYVVHGSPFGYSIDFITIVSKKLGLTVEFVQGHSWSEYIEMLKNKQLNVLVNMINTSERRRYALFTSPYAELEIVAVTRKGEFGSSINKDSLANKRIAFIKGGANLDFIKNLNSSLQIILVDGVEGALNKLQKKEADLFFASGAIVNFYIDKLYFANLAFTPLSEELGAPALNLSFAIHKENPLLANILQKGLDAVPESVQIQLRSKWFNSANSTESGFTYSKMEQDLIDSSEFVICRTDSAGSAIKAVDFIARGTGLKLKVSPRLSWEEAMEALHQGDCDILASATETKSRRETMLFTPEYYRDPVVVITKKGQAQVNDISDHSNKIFAAIRSSTESELFKKTYPEITLVEASNKLDGIHLVQQEKVFGFIEPRGYAKILLKSHALNNLQINGQLRDMFDDVQAIATRKEDKLLNGILTQAVNLADNKMIENILNPEEINEHREVNLTKDELQLVSTREIVWCNSDFNVAWGDVLDFLVKDTGMKLVSSNEMTWGDGLKALENGDCDLLPQITETAERRKTMNFTPSIHQEERVIATLEGQRFIANIEDHLNETFIINRGDLLIEKIREEYPNIKIAQADQIVEGLNLVQSREAFAYLGSISDVGNVIHQYTLSDIKIAGTLPDRFNDTWSIATRKDDVILHSILSKLIEISDNRELRNMFNAQFLVRYENAFDYKLFWQFLIVTLVILTATILWNRRLTKLNYQLAKANRLAEEAQKTIVIQEKMSSLGTLTAGVAHEINNPINFTHAAVYMMKEEIIKIKGFLKKLAGGEKADDKVLQSFEDEFKKLLELTETATQGSNRIKRIVSDLRLFSRLDEAKQEETKLSTIIKSTVHLVKTQFHDTTIELNFLSDPVLICFPAKISQVFMNIIVNACQAIEAQKQLSSMLEGHITITLMTKGNVLIIKCQDNGCGMDDATQQKIFDPFYTTKGVGEGTGLGMAISFGIIEEHDGSIEVESSVSKGSILTIKLPL